MVPLDELPSTCATFPFFCLWFLIPLGPFPPPLAFALCSELVPCILFYCTWVASDGEWDPRIVRFEILDGYWDIANSPMVGCAGLGVRERERTGDGLSWLRGS